VQGDPVNSADGTGNYDVAVIGAGPVGCVAALAFARRGRRVLLLEANPLASHRLAGEWLHPPAVELPPGVVVVAEAKEDSAAAGQCDALGAQVDVALRDRVRGWGDAWPR
jgi:flavin-dependent dehydrogenase